MVDAKDDISTQDSENALYGALIDPVDLLLEKAALCLSSSYSFWPFWPPKSQAYLVAYISLTAEG